MKLITKLNNKLAVFIALAGIFGLSISAVNAQLNPFGSMYFQNQYLGNPAMAGREAGLNVNLGYQQQWNNVPGAPQTQSLTADYGGWKKVGLGINLNNDKAGLLKRTRAMATYAYHLPLSEENSTLSFGISLGFMNQRIDNTDINGNQNDISVMQYNSRENYLDGDFGLAYSGSALNLQAAIPGLKNFIQQDQETLGADRPTFMAAASYKLTLGEQLNSFGVEPKTMYRRIKGHKDIFDAGANVTFANNSANIMVMYHSSQSVTAGLGVNYLSKVQIMGVYTTETAALRSYANGNFEIGVRIKAF